MTTLKQRLLAALTNTGQSYAELAAKVGGNPTVADMNRALRALEAAGQASRYYQRPSGARTSRAVDRRTGPHVFWRCP